jgi:hypothetical protein
MDKQKAYIEKSRKQPTPLNPISRRGGGSLINNEGKRQVTLVK